MYCVLKYSISVYMNMLPCLSCTSPTGVNDFLRYPVVLIIYILTLVACEETASSLNVHKASQVYFAAHLLPPACVVTLVQFGIVLTVPRGRTV